MKRISFCFSCLLTLLVFVVASGSAKQVLASGNIYYVSTTGSDSASGSLSSPFKTLNKAVSVLQPGDTLLIRGGTYNEGLINNIPSGTSWSSPVTLRAYPQETVVVHPTSSSARAIELSNNQQYIIIDGLIMDAAQAGYDGIKINPGPHHIRFINSEVKNAPQQGILVIYGTHDLEFRNMQIHDNGTTDFHHGLYLEGQNIIVDSCNIYRNAGWGVHIYSGYDGVGTPDNIIVSNNLSHDNARVGGRGAGIGVYTGNNNLVYNNVVWGNEYGILNAYGASNTQFYFNTVTGNRSGEMYILSDATGTIAQNNIFYNPSDVQYQSDTSSTKADHNLVGKDPLFVNSSGHDYHLKSGSPAIGFGVGVSVGSTDFDGKTRTSPYTVGAYTYGGVSATPTPTPTPTPSPSPSPTIKPSPSPSPTASATPVTSPSPTVCSGDINGDGVVDLKDYSLLVSDFFGKSARSDLNHDGIVDLKDFSILASRFLKTCQ